MRTLARFTFPVEAGNAAVKDGRLGKLMQSMFDRIKPEATYFLAHDGKRSALVVFDLKEPSDIPAIAEPWFIGLNASVEFSPVMNREDLQAGLEKAMKLL